MMFPPEHTRRADQKVKNSWPPDPSKLPVMRLSGQGVEQLDHRLSQHSILAPAAEQPVGQGSPAGIGAQVRSVARLYASHTAGGLSCESNRCAGVASLPQFTCEICLKFIHGMRRHDRQMLRDEGSPLADAGFREDTRQDVFIEPELRSDWPTRTVQDQLCREGGIMWEKPSWRAARRPIQVANGADLPPMASQMHGLAEAQERCWMWRPAGKDLSEHGVLLQVVQRRLAQCLYKEAVQRLQFLQIPLKIQRDCIGQPLHAGRVLIWALLAMIEARDIPFGFHAEVFDNRINRIRLRQRSPIDLLRGDILEIVLEALPGPLIHLDHELKGLIHGCSPMATVSDA